MTPATLIVTGLRTLSPSEEAHTTQYGTKVEGDTHRTLPRKEEDTSHLQKTREPKPEYTFGVHYVCHRAMTTGN